MEIKIQRANKVVSFVILKNVGGQDREIEYVRTEPEFRRQGLADLGMDRAEKLADNKKWRLIAFVAPTTQA